MPTPIALDNVEACVDAVLARIGKRIVLGLPVGIGKPNSLVNAFVCRAMADASIRLTIFTALSLRAPRWRSDLERRFLEPFVQRVFGGYVELDYVRLLERGALPDNIEVNEFFLEPGGWLRNEHLQQNYLSANYTHVARDLIQRGVNVIAQSVAPSPNDDAVSLSCNPDLTVDLLPHIESMRATGKPFALIGQLHPDLPFMYGDAVLSRSAFDMLIEPLARPDPLFGPPNMPIGTTDYAIALNVATLVKDGGTLQLGIGELGDAIVYALKLRHEQPEEFAAVLGSLGTCIGHESLVRNEGGTERFTHGLYACTEMLVDGFIDLYRAGVLKRRVYPHTLLQHLLDAGRIAESVDDATLRALADAGLDRLSARDFEQLQMAGVFRDGLAYRAGSIVTTDGRAFSTHLADNNVRQALSQSCLGTHLRNGVLAHGGFFFGPKAFYAALHDLPEDERRQFHMQRISFVNELYGDQHDLKVAQRRHARFINTTMMITGLGAAVSDALAEGHVVSGIGGQYNFVTMAHALPEARSILCVRSTRTSQGRTQSNIVWNYGHISIPRHLRDIVVTEYGIADLRGRTDGEVIAALIDVMDARFQDEFVARAKRSGKLAADYQVPERARGNTPDRLEDVLRPFRQRGLFAPLPFGSDFTAEELVIARALKSLQSAASSRSGRIKTLASAILSGSPDAKLDPYLQRLSLAKPRSIAQHIEQRAVANALRGIL